MLRKTAAPFILVLVYILFLLILSGEGILRATYSIAQQVRSAQTSYRQVDDSLESIRLEIYKVAVAARDGLLDHQPRQAHAAVEEHSREIARQVQFLKQETSAANSGNIRRIDEDVRAYLKTIHAVIDQADSADSQKRLASVVGRRQTIVDISAALSQWNDADFETEQKAIDASLGGLRNEIAAILSLILLLGTGAALAAFDRISRIQKSNQEAHGKTAEAREQLKHLSRQLVSAQEAERKALARELHDEIGQSLTALKLELANSERIARSEGSAVTVHLQTIREIADETLRATKNISLGLRPPMLDDLGLVSALNWFTAEFARRTGITVDFSADGAVSQLPEAQRTCIYRVVQEALANCARHALAQRITVKLDASGPKVTLIVSDNGGGFDTSEPKGQGLGLLSMQERAAELGGTLQVTSSKGHGTTIQVSVPSTPVMV